MIEHDGGGDVSTFTWWALFYCYECGLAMLHHTRRGADCCCLDCKHNGSVIRIYGVIEQYVKSSVLTPHPELDGETVRLAPGLRYVKANGNVG